MDQECWDSGQEGLITVQTYQGILKHSKGKWILQYGWQIGSVPLELKQEACIMTESSDLAANAETEIFAYFKPTKRQKVIEKQEGIA